MRGCKDLLITADTNPDSFYTFSDQDNAISGKLAWAHVTYPYTYPKILKIKESDPRDESKTVFVIKPYSTGDENHYPLHSFGLKNEELLYVLNGKKRLVVTLAEVESSWYANEKLCLVAPVFSFKERQSDEFIYKTQAFAYPDLFYLPDSSIGCIEESVIRLQMLQPVPAKAIQAYNSRYKGEVGYSYLSSVAYGVLITHFLRFIGYPDFNKSIAETIDAYKELILSSIVKNS